MTIYSQVLKFFYRRIPPLKAGESPLLIFICSGDDNFKNMGSAFYINRQ
ncbi:hypothetical protein SAMN03159353_100941 [Cedecea sp. NFIX57]|nr:hypothetical protein SAMN03159353_100941 [Cedecea sp. NFIX57]